jgi:hypothetical protein
MSEHRVTALGMAGDTVTVLRSRGRRLAKLIGADGTIENYDSARLFDLFSVPVGGLDDLHELLVQLLDKPDCCIVRGAIADPSLTRGARRLVYPDPETGDRPTLIDAPRRWLALDFDSVPRPETIAASDLSGCAAIAFNALPSEFRDVRGIAQATASHSIKPHIRLRLFFWLDRPTTGAQAKIWLRAAAVDQSVFGAGQVIYTARPTFSFGANDPLGERLVMLPGRRDTVPVPAASTLASPARRQTVSVTADAGGAGRYGFAALTAATARVMRAADGARHPTLLAEATGLAHLVARNLLSASAVRDALCGAAERAGLPEGEAANVIGWALARSAGPAPGAVR